MPERRNIGRVDYKVPSVVVICETGEVIYVEVDNASPEGMGLWMKDNRPDILAKDIIIVAKTMIMYAIVKRVEEREDGTFTVGIRAQTFTKEVLEYLFEHIGTVDAIN